MGPPLRPRRCCYRLPFVGLSSQLHRSENKPSHRLVRWAVFSVPEDVKNSLHRWMREHTHTTTHASLTTTEQNRADSVKNLVSEREVVQYDGEPARSKQMSKESNKTHPSPNADSRSTAHARYRKSPRAPPSRRPRRPLSAWKLPCHGGRIFPDTFFLFIYLFSCFI